MAGINVNTGFVTTLPLSGGAGGVTGTGLPDGSGNYTSDEIEALGGGMGGDVTEGYVDENCASFEGAGGSPAVHVVEEEFIGEGKDREIVRLLREGASKRLTAWHVDPQDGISHQLDAAFFSGSGRLFDNGRLSAAKLIGQSGNAYLLERKGELTCWIEDSNREWFSIRTHYLPALGQVFHDGELSEAKVVERIGDNVLIEAEGYNGPAAWRVHMSGASAPARRTYFPKSRKLTVAYGQVKETITVMRDGDIYLLKDESPNRSVRRPYFAIKVDPSTGSFDRVERHFFINPNYNAWGSYISPETGLRNAVVVNGDLFSERNAMAIRVAGALFERRHGFVFVDTQGRLLQNQIYPHPNKENVFWVTDKKGLAMRIKADRIGDGPFYIFNIPQRIRLHEATYYSSGNAENIFVYLRRDGETRRATEEEIKSLAAQQLGSDAPDAELPRKVAVVGEMTPIRSKGKMRINNGFSQRVRVAGKGFSRVIRVKIEANSEAEAGKKLDDLLNAFRRMPAPLFKVVRVFELYSGRSTEYGFQKKQDVGGSYTYGRATGRVFEVSSLLDRTRRQMVTHELMHSLVKDRDRVSVLLAIAADGDAAGDRLTMAVKSGYARVAWFEWVPETAAAMTFGGVQGEIFNWARFTCRAIAHMFERPIETKKRRRGTDIAKTGTMAASASQSASTSHLAAIEEAIAADDVEKLLGAMLAAPVSVALAAFKGIMDELPRLRRRLETLLNGSIIEESKHIATTAGDDLPNRVSRANAFYGRVNSLLRFAAELTIPLKTGTLALVERTIEATNKKGVILSRFEGSGEIVEIPGDIFSRGLDRIVFGRGAYADVQIVGESISREHLIFERDGGTWSVRSGGAKSPTITRFIDTETGESFIVGQGEGAIKIAPGNYEAAIIEKQPQTLRYRDFYKGEGDQRLLEISRSYTMTEPVEIVRFSLDIPPTVD